MPKPKKTAVDAYLMQATCAVVQRNKENKSEAIATAWLASSEGHLVTAGHTFSEKQKTGTTVEIQFLNEAPKPALIVETVHDKAAGLDFAILKLSTPPEEREPLKFMLVNEASGEFLLRGYGSSLPNSQSPGKGEFIGQNIRAGDTEHVLFQLRSPELAFEGFSGGAVFSPQLGAVIAIQIEARKDSDTILAMPLFRIPKYWAEIANLASLPGTCFVVAPQDRLSKLVDKVIKPVIAEELGYEVKISETGKVGSNDLAQLEKSELIIADVTGSLPHVIYELTVAHGLGTPDIILGERNDETHYRDMPFKVTEIQLDEIQQTQDQLRSKIEAIKSTVAALEDIDNPIISSLQAPLPQISPAYGLALGYFHNFILRVAAMLSEARYDEEIIITIAGKAVPFEKRQNYNMQLNIIIPKRLYWASHDFVGLQIVKRRLAIEASISRKGQSRPFPLWALKQDDEQTLVLIDFPTAVGSIAPAIDQRLHVNPDSGRHTITWREIEDKEINRFSSSLGRLIKDSAESGKVPELPSLVKVTSWETLFPQLSHIP